MIDDFIIHSAHNQETKETNEAIVRFNLVPFCLPAHATFVYRVGRKIVVMLKKIRKSSKSILLLEVIMYLLIALTISLVILLL